MENYLYRLATDKEEGFIACVFKFFLYLLSLIYGFFVKILLFYYRFNSYKLNCKVISIGNITLGGTGKTPFVEILAKHLRQKGRRIAILSRGYKGKDEAYLLSKKLVDVVVLVGRNRIENAKIAKEKYNVDTIILDDGFQHWRIFRDLDIVLIDINNPFGNNYLLPRGILREPISSLERAEIIFLTKVDLPGSCVQGRGLKGDNLLLISRIKKINPKAEVFKAIYQPQNLTDLYGNLYPLSFIKEKRICLLCGIADPAYFEFALNNLGLELTLRFIFPDHHIYKEKEIDKIINSCIEKNVKIIVTTEKDNVRLERFQEKLKSYLFILCSRIKILENEDDFFKRADSLYLS